jgi:hypothetical protein
MRKRHWSIPAGAVAAVAMGDAAPRPVAAADLQPPPLAASVAPLAPAPTQLPSPVRDPGNPFVRFFRNAEWYGSWGYSKQYWAPSDIHVSQATQGNNFTIHGVQGTDGFSFSDIFGSNLFAPQYNIRFGRFINDARTIAVELSLDHSKYQTTIGQTAQVTGTIAGAPVNASAQLTSQTFSEVLHNGANHVMINAVYRYPLIGQTNETLSVAAIAKAGVGVMLPHTTDTVLGNVNDVGNKTFGNAVGLNNGWWQLNGWTAGVELGFRAVLYKPLYLEVTDKVAYSYLADLPAFQGTLQQSLWMNEIVVSLGLTYDGPR